MAERENRWEIPALLAARIWLGLEQQEHAWRRMQQEGEVAVFAETVGLRQNFTKFYALLLLKMIIFRVALSRKDVAGPPNRRYILNSHVLTAMRLSN